MAAPGYPWDQRDQDTAKGRVFPEKLYRCRKETVGGGKEKCDP